MTGPKHKQIAVISSLLILGVAALLGACSSSPKDESCSENVAIECQCEDGRNGAQRCLEGAFGACDCSGATAPTTPAGSVGTCVYKTLGSGKRICLLSESQTFGNGSAVEGRASALVPGKADGREDPNDLEWEEPAQQSEDLFAQCQQFTFHDQGDLGWCVVHSILGAMELKYCIDGKGKATVPLSEPHLWHLGKPSSGMNGLCYTGGWFIQDAMKVAEYEWVAESTIWPFPAGLECDTVEAIQATDKAIAEGYPGESVLDLRDDFTIHGHQHIPEKNATAIRAELAKGNPVVVSVPLFQGVGWYSDEVDEQGVPIFQSIAAPLTPPAVPAGGKGDYCWCDCTYSSGNCTACPDHEYCHDGFHAIFLVGYDNSTQRFRMVNSWGQEWKKNSWGSDWVKNGGTFYIDYEYMEKYSRGGGAVWEVWKGDSSDDPIIPDDKTPGAVGTPCLNDSACTDGYCLKTTVWDPNAAIVTELETGFLDGYCTILDCTPDAEDCPENSICVNPDNHAFLEDYFDRIEMKLPTGVCVETCQLQQTVSESTSCRTGYGCHPRGKDEAGVCLPRCKDNLVCGEFAHCFSDTGACLWTCAKGQCIVPAGPFTMGCYEGHYECGWGDSPQVGITLSAYEIDMEEVTRSEYYACMQAGGCSSPEEGVGDVNCMVDQYGKNESLDSWPVNCVTWQQSRDYCLWNGQRLCTEAEWEKAARGAADVRETPWGGPNDDIPCDHAHIFWENYLSGSPEDCIPGGQSSQSSVWGAWRGASPYGARLMMGNVMEWTADYADEFAYVDGVTDPSGPGDGVNRIARGHHFMSQSKGPGLRLSQRFAVSPDDRVDLLGFRCCRDSDNGDKVPWENHFMPPFMH